MPFTFYVCVKVMEDVASLHELAFHLDAFVYYGGITDLNGERVT